MNVRALMVGIVVSGVLTSSCASTARDTLVDIYDDDVLAVNLDETCRINARTFEATTDAYIALNGQEPSAESDLVPDYLRLSPDDWQFDPAAESFYSPTPGGRCDGVNLERDEPSTFGQDAVDSLEDTRIMACDTDKRQVEVALEAHFAVKGFDATTIAELAEFGVKDELNRWTLQLPTDATSAAPMVVATVGGPCDN